MKEEKSPNFGRLKNYVGGKWIESRITSYNVCYTKLLRVLRDARFEWRREAPDLYEPLVAAPLAASDFFCRNASAGGTVAHSQSGGAPSTWRGRPLPPALCQDLAVDSVLAIRLGEGEFEGLLLVITSYSIHYTKLYDFNQGQCCRNNGFNNRLNLGFGEIELHFASLNFRQV